MDLSEYGISAMAAIRLAEARSVARKQALLDSLERPRSGLAKALGHALVSLGQRLIGPHATPRAALR